MYWILPTRVAIGENGQVVNWWELYSIFMPDIVTISLLLEKATGRSAQTTLSKIRQS
jgi:hypothetical protein